MNLAPAGSGRLAITLAVLVVLALLVWQTMEPGRVRDVTWLLLGFFAFKSAIGWMRAR
ncbi:MAG TPA: hypothetical protein VMD97_07820 [Candidatus Aquilonibacter sp.]|nr:hypothetical protein [Candidatus Aquilonibacter sp.]